MQSIPDQRFMPRAAALKEICDHLADRTAFVFGLCAADPRRLLQRMSTVPQCDYYADNGTGIVMSIAAPFGADMLRYLYGVAPERAMGVVAVVPKTVPATMLSAVLGVPVPEDGSRDVIMLLDEDGETISWPHIMIDAVERVYPDFAQAIRDAEVKR